MNAEEFSGIGGILSENMEQSSKNLDLTCSVIREYIQNEAQRTARLSEETARYHRVFETLTGTASSMLESVQAINKKIAASCSAVEVIEHADTMLKDINESFPALVNRDTIEKEKKIQLILDNLNVIGYKCEHLQNFPKPYNDMVDLYNIKINSVFDTLVKESINLEVDKIAEEHGRLQKAIEEKEWQNSSLSDELKKAAEHRDLNYAALQKSLEYGTAKEEQVKLLSGELAEARKSTAGNGPPAEEYKRLQKTIKEKEEENAGLIDELRRKTTQYEDRFQKTKTGLIAAVFGLVISIIISVGIYNDMDSERSILLSENYNMHSQIDTLEKAHTNSKNVWAINVTDMQVGNANSSNGWITKPGIALEASRVRFLNPVFTYNAPISSSEPATFYIKFIQPNGTVFRNASTSPNDFTFSKTRNIHRGQSLSLDLDGWGHASQNVYSPGVWTIELWYQGFCLYSGKVTLR